MIEPIIYYMKSRQYFNGGVFITQNHKILLDLIDIIAENGFDCECWDSEGYAHIRL